MNDIIKNYELRKKDVTFEIWFIENIQYNFKLDDIKELLNITDEHIFIFKKYLVYLDVYRVNYPFCLNKEDAINNFYSVIKDDTDKDLLLSIFTRHKSLFMDKNEVRRLKLVPNKYNNRIFRGI